jgi:hypothetical protein
VGIELRRADEDHVVILDVVPGQRIASFKNKTGLSGVKQPGKQESPGSFANSSEAVPGKRVGTAKALL